PSTFRRASLLRPLYSTFLPVAAYAPPPNATQSAMKAITVPADGRRVNSFFIENHSLSCRFERSATRNSLKRRSCGGCEDACNGPAEAGAQDTRSGGFVGELQGRRQEDGFEPSARGDGQVPPGTDSRRWVPAPGPPRADGAADGRG